MDPSYKNFVSWKKSFRGQAFLSNKDSDELIKLQTEFIDPSHSQKSGLKTKSKTLNPIPEHRMNEKEDPVFEITDDLLNEIGLNFDFSNSQVKDAPEVIEATGPNQSSRKDQNSANIDRRRDNLETNQDKNKAEPRVYNNKDNKSISYKNMNISLGSTNNQKPYINTQGNNSSFNKYYHALNHDTSKTISLNKLAKKKRNIFFQVISRDLVAIESDFFLEAQLMSIIKEYNGKFDRECRLWYAPYKNYIQIYKKLKECSALGETTIHPITNLPLEFLSSPQKLTILKFEDENRRTFTIDYSKDPTHTIYELSGKMLSNLYNFQKSGIEFGIKKNGRMLLADEMGVGKTIQAIGVSAIFKEDWPVLILCPSSLKYNWRDEILNWLGDFVTAKEIQIIKSSKDDLKPGVKYYILSYDLSIRIEAKIREKNIRFAIADEVHYLKNKDSKRSKLMIPILQKCKRCVLLSGTPILARPIEAFPILKCLRPDIFTGFKAFGTRYCDPKQTPFGIDWSGSTNSKELHFILSNLMIRRLKKDVLAELPPKKRQKVEVMTDKKVINQIRVLLNKSKVNVDSDRIFTELNIDLIDDEAKPIENEGDELSCFTKAYSLTGKAKLPGIREYINYLIENNCKFLIFAHHMEVLDGIEEEVIKQKVNYIRIDGSVGLEKRHECVRKFQNDDNCLIAILAITACATGLTLTKASTVVFAEMHFTPATMIQAEDRAHRIGQEHNCVNVHYLYAPETVDEIIFDKLREKFFVVSSTLDDKRMDMDVEKLKTGCMGEVAKRKGDKEDTNDETTLSEDTTTLSSNLRTSTQMKGSGKKNMTLTDFFKPKTATKEKEMKIIKEEDDFNELLNDIMMNKEFTHSLDNNEKEEKRTEEKTTTAENTFIDINIHFSAVKRTRNSERKEYSLLNTSEEIEENEILNKRKKTHARTKDKKSE